MEIRDAATILGVPVDASSEQVRNAYRSRARLLHPDRFSEASAADRKTAQIAMAQLNQANDTLVRHFQRSRAEQPPSEADPAPSSDAPELLADYQAMLCPDRGQGIMGTLLIARFDGRQVVPIFRSFEVDVRGEPFIASSVPLASGTKAKRGGRLDLVGGGYLLIHGGKSRAEAVMEALEQPPNPPPRQKKPPPAAPRPEEMPRTPPAPTRREDLAPISKDIPKLANIAQGQSHFTIEISPGQVDLCPCLSLCSNRRTHTCALGATEAEDLAQVLRRAADTLHPAPVPLPEDLDDLSVRRLNPGEINSVVLVDWRSSFPETDGELARAAWPCVTLMLRGRTDQPASTLAAFVRALSSAAIIAEEWEKGNIGRSVAQIRLSAALDY